MKKLAKVCAAGSLLFGTTAVVNAEISANVGLSSDYVFRGISQTDNTASLSGGFDYTHDSGFYAGVWAANVDENFYPGSNLEIDTYFGISGGEKLTWDVGYLRYNYPGTSFNDNNTDEVHGSLGYDFGVFSITGGVAHSPDFYGLDDAEYYTLDVAVPMPAACTLALHYGDQEIEDGIDYDHYSIGMSREFVGLGFDLTFYGGAGEALLGSLDDDRVVFTISKSL